jgi:hypothetical protein
MDNETLIISAAMLKQNSGEDPQGFLADIELLADEYEMAAQSSQQPGTSQVN